MSISRRDSVEEVNDKIRIAESELRRQVISVQEKITRTSLDSNYNSRMILDIVTRISRLEQIKRGDGTHIVQGDGVNFNILLSEMGELYQNVGNKFQMFLVDILYKNLKYINPTDLENTYKIFKMVSCISIKKEMLIVIRIMKKRRMYFSTWDNIKCVFIF